MPSGAEWFIVLAVVLVIFGGSQLPKLAKNLGKAQKEFKDGLAEGQVDTPTDAAAARADTPAAAGAGSGTEDRLTTIARSGRAHRAAAVRDAAVATCRLDAADAISRRRA